MSLCVHNDMKSRGHVRRADHTEGDGVAEDVSGNLPARVENQILGNNHPVKVFQGKVGLDMKDNILTNIDGLGGAVNKDVMIFALMILTWFLLRKLIVDSKTYSLMV